MRHPGRRFGPVAVALWLLLAGCSSSPGSPSTPTSPTTAQPAPTSPGTTAPPTSRPICGGLDHPPATWAHVIWIWMENRDYRHVVGNPQAPYENSTLISRCGLATNYHNITHPSLPNYLAARAEPVRPGSGGRQELACLPGVDARQLRPHR